MDTDILNLIKCIKVIGNNDDNIKDKKSINDLCDLVIKDINIDIDIDISTINDRFLNNIKNNIINTQELEYKKNTKDNFIELDIDEWKEKSNGAESDCHHQIVFSKFGITLWKVMNCSKDCKEHYHEFYSITVLPKYKEDTDKSNDRNNGPQYVNCRKPKYIKIIDGDNYVMFMLAPDPPHSVEGTLSEGKESKLAFYRIEFGEYK
jgi:hypothetical protein